MFPTLMSETKIRKFRIINVFVVSRNYWVRFIYYFLQMTREEKLEAIYKEIANKKRTFGCRCRINDGEDVIFIRQNKTWSYLSIRENEEFTVSLWYTPEIIWHPVMIWDVLDWIEPYWSGYVQSVEFTDRRRKKRILFYFSGTTRGFRLTSSQMSV